MKVLEERVPAPRKKTLPSMDTPKSASGALAEVLPRSLAEQVADSIVDGIAAGVLKPGQRVLEVELARQLRVSRVPIREALKFLGAQGILESAAHRGTYIAEFDQANVDRICEVRAALEGIAIRHALQTYASFPNELDKLKAIIETMESCVSHEDRIGVNKADIAFHRAICAASRNEIVITLWETLARHVLIIFGRETLSSAARLRIVDQHKRMYNLLKGGNQGRLEVEVEVHIMRGRGMSSGEDGGKRLKRR